jgi:hypothetical protein
MSKESGPIGPDFRVSGVGCQERNTRKLKPETSGTGKAIEL